MFLSFAAALLPGDALMTNFKIQGVNLAGAFVGMFVIGRIGRKTLMGTFQLIEGILLIVFGFLFAKTWLDGAVTTVDNSSHKQEQADLAN